MRLTKLIRRLAYGPKGSSVEYIAHLRAQGMVIGDNTVIYSPTHCVIDVTRPWMIEIGDNVSITEGVTILTHGYDWSVFKGKYGHVLGSAGRVKIGDNVFIGMNTTILKGVTIGCNVVIGANSLINKDVPDDCVVVGNPQHVICTIDEYLEKRRAVQIDEAAEMLACWLRNSPEGRSGQNPPRELFREFFWLFEEGVPGRLSCQEYENVMSLCGTYDASAVRFEKTQRQFDSYEAFLSEARRKASQLLKEWNKQ